MYFSVRLLLLQYIVEINFNMFKVLGKKGI